MRAIQHAGMLILFLATSAATAPDNSIRGLPPVVVQTVPRSGDSAVEPSVGEIRVTFSKDMLDQSWSWVIVTKESFPVRKDKPRFLEDHRTCVWPVVLEPGKTYAMWINTDRQTGFMDLDRHASVPYLLVFQTKK